VLRGWRPRRPRRPADEPPETAEPCSVGTTHGREQRSCRARRDQLLPGAQDDHPDPRAGRAAAALRSSSSWTPRNPSRSQTSRRTRAEPSPMPAVKTSASTPPAATAIAATAAATRYASSPSANAAWSSVRRSSSRTSPVPARPASPEAPFSSPSISSIPSPSRWTCRSAPGSTDPARVGIGTPSSGVKPIVVSTDRPSRTAVTEQPPPRWQTTSRGTRTLPAAHSTERPWKPKRRTPHATRQRSGTA
jgi:hypothetical protein